MAFQGDSIFWVEVEKIVPNPFQPRREFNQEKLQELADSIRMYGVLQPLTVTRKEVHRDDGTFFTEYELIAGERRLRASKLANVEQVPVIIRSGEQTEQEKLELAIIENLQREDLNAVDRALAFKQLADAFNLSITQVAKKVGRSREYVSNSIRLLVLPDHILDSIKTGDITEGHGRTLLMLKDRPEELEVVYREILLKKLSVREVERIARKIATDKVRKKSWANTDAHLIEMEREFTDTLGTRVQISKTDYGGKLTIDYFTESELEKLLHVIKSQRTLLESATDQSDAAPKIQELAEVESALAALAESTPLATETREEQPVEDVAVADQAESTQSFATTNTAAPVGERHTEPAEQTAAPTEASVDPEQTHVPAFTRQEQEASTYMPTMPAEEPAEQALQHAEVRVETESDSAPDITAAPDVSRPNQESFPPTPDPHVEAVAVSSQYHQYVQSTAEPNVTPENDSYTNAPHTNYHEQHYPAHADASVRPAPVATETREPSVPMIVATYNDKKSFITDAINMNRQSAAQPAAPTEHVSVQPTPPEEDSGDEDLYSINRFSI